MRDPLRSVWGTRAGVAHRKQEGKSQRHEQSRLRAKQRNLPPANTRGQRIHVLVRQRWVGEEAERVFHWRLLRPALAPEVDFTGKYKVKRRLRSAWGVRGWSGEWWVSACVGR